MPAADCLHDTDFGGPVLRRRAINRLLCWDAGLPRALVERMWSAPHALLGEGFTLQHKQRCTVVRLDAPDGSFVWKHHNWGTLGRTLKKTLSRSAGRKAWQDGHFLANAGVPTPRPRAYAERTWGPFQRHSYVLTDFVPGTSLYRFMRYESPSRETILDLARQVAAIWQKLDDLKVWHNDFKTENFLVDPNGKVWLIDLERARRYRDQSKMRRRQTRDAADFLHPRNWRSDPEAAEVFRREILKTPAAAATLSASPGISHPLRNSVRKRNQASQLLTVVIPCRYSAASVLECIDSVRDMADEILVADGGSTDDTLRVVRNRGDCRVIECPAEEEPTFESWAFSQARHNWVLRLLPDERLSPDLARKIQDVLADEPEESGFRLTRAVHFRGQRLRHGVYDSERSLRLFRKDLVRVDYRDGRIDVGIAAGRIGELKSPLDYEVSGTVLAMLHDLFRASGEAAQTDMQRGVRASLGNVLLRAPWEFVKSYVLRRGCLDGWAGLYVSSHGALSIFLRELMLWEMRQNAQRRHAVGPSNWREFKVFDPYQPAEGEIEPPTIQFEQARPRRAA